MKERVCRVRSATRRLDVCVRACVRTSRDKAGSSFSLHPSLSCAVVGKLTGLVVLRSFALPTDGSCDALMLTGASGRTGSWLCCLVKKFFRHVLNLCLCVQP